MKHLKMLGLAAVAAAALMALVGASTASATILEGDAGARIKTGEELHAVLEPETVAELEAGVITVKCEESTIQVKITDEGSATTTVKGETTTVTFSKCNCEPITVNNGSLEIHAIPTTAGSGTLTASGFTATVPCKTIFGTVTCKYITGNNKDMGTLIGSTDREGLTATMKVETALTRDEGSSELCNQSASWKAKYVITTPMELNVTEN